MVVRTQQATTEPRREKACLDFACGISRDNVGQAATLIGSGGAALKIHVYPCGAEFDVVENEGMGLEGDSDASV